MAPQSQVHENSGVKTRGLTRLRPSWKASRLNVNNEGLIPFLVPSLLLLASAGLMADSPQEQVPVWGRFEVAVVNSKSYANPFADVALRGTLLRPNGGEVACVGFHDGDGRGGQTGNVWKLRFMPDEAGRWRYTYTWSDGTVGGGGGFAVVGAGLPGPIVADERNPRVWRVTGAREFIPCYVAGPPYWQTDDPRMEAFLDFAAGSLGANGVALILHNRVWLDCQDETDCSPSRPVFSIRTWRQLDDFLTRLQARGMGANVMFYTDDEGRPRFAGGSEKERLLFQYAIARLAAYPMITYDTGIDITEYRSREWNEAFAGRLGALSARRLMISSRHETHSKAFRTASFSYDSLGDVHPGYEEILATMSATRRPVLYADRWREDFFRGNFSRHGIRHIMWHCALAGGAGFMIGGKHGDFRLDDYETDLDIPKQFRVFSDFWHKRLAGWGQFVVCNDLVTRGCCCGERGKQYVAYLREGGRTTVDLSSCRGLLTVVWLDPRTGARTVADAVRGGRRVDFQAPDGNDWVLWLGGVRPDETPPTVPGDLKVIAAGADRVELTWERAKDADTGISAYKVYRDGALVARTLAGKTACRDVGVSELTGYGYQVSAVNGTGIEGRRTGAVRVETPPDRTPPRVSSAKAIGDPRQVRVRFSEPVERASAEKRANYAITGGISITQASLGPDGVTLRLATTPLSSGVSYVLTLSNVKDRAAAGNVIAAGSKASFALAERVRDGLVVLYGFDEQQGTVVRDVSGVGEPLDLTLANASAAKWVPGGVAILGETMIVSSEPAAKITKACAASGEITLEAWLKPANRTQDGPARIASLSLNASTRNFTLGQSATRYDMRLRTTATTQNGSPSLGTTEGAVTTQLTHMVYTRSASGERKLYVNGTERAAGAIGGDLSNWAGSFRFALGNEISGGRPWLGELRLVAVYDRALRPEEVRLNFEVGG